MESSDRKQIAQNQRAGACSDRKSRSTFSEHAQKQIWVDREIHPAAGLQIPKARKRGVAGCLDVFQ
jgi:hypothetical protein